MRNLKKLLAVIVSVCVLATFALPAFAAEQTAAEICEDLGVLKGEGSDGVSDAYLAKGTSRMQAALLYLRLIGKEDEALAFEGEDNFADADQTWAAARPVLAYLKANPELGWQGVGADKFDPKATASAQMMYKVCLEALGYKQDAEDGFKWADVFTFAADKGLSLIADVTDLTNNDVAIALVETLKLNLKDSTTTLAADLVAKGIVTEAAAEAAGLIGGYVALDVDKVKGATNARVDIALKTAADKVDASKISIKDAAGVALEAKSVSISPVDSKTVIVATAAQTVGTLYTITIDGKDYVFTGMPKDTTKPALKTVIAETNTSVKVTFDNIDLDEITAVDPANYTIADLTVSAAKFGDDHSVVILTTSAQTSGKLYELKVANITDTSGNVIDSSVSKKFGGKAADTTKPTVKTVVSKKGNTVEVTFTEAQLLSDNALDIANYTINNDVTVTAAKFKKDTNKVGAFDPVVILSTSDQTNGKLYKLTVKNVADDSGNVIDSVDKNFGGTALDTTKIGITSVLAETNTKIVVVLDDEVDKATVLPENFTVDGLTITAAELDADISTNDTVNLTTSAQTGGKLYTLTISNLKDLAGNGVNTDKDDKKFGGKAADTSKPTISKVEAVDRNTVKVTFSEKVDKATAETLSNYVFDGGLYYPTLATLDGTAKNFVTLKTLDQSAKVYELKISNVQDLSGNVIEANASKKFAGIGDALAKVKLDSAYATDKQTIVLTFNQTLNATAAETEANYTIKSETNSATNIGTTTGAVVASPAVASYDKDSKTVTITFPNTKYMNSSELYTVTITGITGEYGAVIDTDNDEQQFAGIDAAKADITISLVNVIDKNTVELVFSEKVSGTVVASNIGFYTDEGAIATSTMTGAVAVGGTATIDGNKVKVKGLTAALADNTVYYVNLGATAIKDISGLYAVKVDDADDKSEAVFATGTIDAVKLKADFAQAINVNTVEVYFNYNLNKTTAETITLAELQAGVEIKDSAAVVSGTEFKGYKVKDNKLTLFFDDVSPKLVPGSVYDVVFSNDMLTKLVYANSAVALGASDTADQKTQVAAVDTANDVPYMVSATAIADDTVKVILSEEVVGLDESDIKMRNTATGIIVDANDYDLTYTAGDDYFTVKLETGAGKFIAGTTYEIAMKDTANVTGFAGIGDIKKAGASNWDESVTFTGAGSVTALTLDDDEFTLTFGAVDADDTIAVTADGGLVASTVYYFVIEGDTDATETMVRKATDVDKIIPTTAFGSSEEGLTGEDLVVKVYDGAGNLLGTTGTLTVA